MDKHEELRQLVAQFLDVDPGQLTPSFSLGATRLRDSIARYSLDTAIRRRLGLRSTAVHSAKTYGDLENGLLGSASAPQEAASLEAAVPVAPEPEAVDVETPHTVSAGPLSCGIDIELVANLPEADDYWTSDFYAEAFAPTEIAYCQMQEYPRMHFAARWCAKEALIKCDSRFSKAEFAKIELQQSASGSVALYLRRNGNLQRLPYAVSLTHTTLMAAAIVVRQG